MTTDTPHARTPRPPSRPTRPCRPSTSAATSPARRSSCSGRTPTPTSSAQWIGPGRPQRRDPAMGRRATAASWRFTDSTATTSQAFRGCFHTVRPDRIVQTFTWEGMPDERRAGDADLRGPRRRPHPPARASRCATASRPATRWLRSGMETGVNDGLRRARPAARRRRRLTNALRKTAGHASRWSHLSHRPRPLLSLLGGCNGRDVTEPPVNRRSRQAPPTARHSEQLVAVRRVGAGAGDGDGGGARQRAAARSRSSRRPGPASRPPSTSRSHSASSIAAPNVSPAPMVSATSTSTAGASTRPSGRTRSRRRGRGSPPPPPARAPSSRSTDRSTVSPG